MANDRCETGTFRLLHKSADREWRLQGVTLELDRILRKGDRLEYKGMKILDEGRQTMTFEILPK